MGETPNIGPETARTVQLQAIVDRLDEALNALDPEGDLCFAASITVRSLDVSLTYSRGCNEITAMAALVESAVDISRRVGMPIDVISGVPDAPPEDL